MSPTVAWKLCLLLISAGIGSASIQSYRVDNQVRFNIWDDLEDDFRYIGVAAVEFPVYINLKAIFPFRKSRLQRSIAEDQLDVFGKIEDFAERMGMNGRRCLLRLICESQRLRISESSVLGEFVAAMISPHEDTSRHVSAYATARIHGARGAASCLKLYPGCPVSLESLGRNVTVEHLERQYSDFE